ncbi:MAG TPA: MbtH family NRPS accessory protein [Pseudonocardiaceae bacterium]|nr:MbtH family NRPS accessory protein [Pseudonocardiaceae bacterium]
MDDDRTYRVVRNDEEQFSIWPDGRELPAGWHAAEIIGTRQECLDHIAEVWTDMRPLSLRRRMADAGSGQAVGAER